MAIPIKSYKSTGRFFEKLGTPRPILDADGKVVKAQFISNAFWKEPERGIGKLSELVNTRDSEGHK